MPLENVSSIIFAVAVFEHARAMVPTLILEGRLPRLALVAPTLILEAAPNYLARPRIFPSLSLRILFEHHVKVRRLF